jgi:hypothetical protein
MSGVRRLGELTLNFTPSDVVSRVNHLIRATFANAVTFEVTLAEGLNKFGHGMGVEVAHFVHAALPNTGVFVANAQAENPYPDKQLWVRMSGTAEIDALLFLFPTLG